MRPALALALQNHARHLSHWLDSPPQTNEVRRSAVLIAAGHWLARRFGLPMVLSELGASAGSNLIWDQHALESLRTGLRPRRAPAPADARMGRPAATALPACCRRPRGRRPEPADLAADRLRILSYIWAGQDRPAGPHPRRRRPGGGLSRHGDARRCGGLVGDRLATPRPGHLHLVFHTIAWQYFPAAAQARGAALLTEAGARATPDAPLARLAMEADAAPGRAAVTLTVWPGGTPILMARAGFHGQHIHWLA